MRSNGLNLCLWYRGIIPQLVERLDGFDASTDEMHTDEVHEDKEQDMRLQRAIGIVADNVSVTTKALRTSNGLEMQGRVREEAKEKESAIKRAETKVATSASSATDEGETVVSETLYDEALLVREGTIGPVGSDADAVDNQHEEINKRNRPTMKIQATTLHHVHQ